MRPTSQVQKNKSCIIKVKKSVVFQTTVLWPFHKKKSNYLRLPKTNFQYKDLQNEIISLLISYHCAAAKLSLVAERVRSAAMAISTIQTVQVSKAHIREIIEKQL